MAITFKPYFVECITNMHVGSGDTNYGIVDKLVQRDPVTHFPTIHSTSLKGALRAHFEDKWKGDSRVANIFGKEGKDSETGDFKFLTADLVAIPVRSTFQNFVLATNRKLIEQNNIKAQLLSKKKIFVEPEDANKLFYSGNEAPARDTIFAEDIKLGKTDFKSVLDTIGFAPLSNLYATLKNEEFAQSTNDLPVIARNKVGENLWYEEVVPHKTVFITYIGIPNNDTTKFEETLQSDLVQIGANASVGYGLCQFTPITFKS